jgi:hypothetical protein
MTRSDPPGAAASRLSRALQSISRQAATRNRPALRLLGRGDPFDRLVPSRLLEEAVARALIALPPDAAPLVAVFDRLGGADGAEAGTSLLRLLADRGPGASLVHAAFNTPPRGLGALIRTGLTRAGAELGIPVEVVAHDGPARALKATAGEAEQLLAGVSLAVIFAPRGAAGLQGDAETGPRRDPLLERSHVAVLSYPDPEFLVADLDRLAAIISGEPGIDAVRFWVQADTGQGFEELGHALLADPGDARERLWVLLDNARRLRYRVLVEPMLRGLPAGDPLVCPCRRLVEDELREALAIERVVAAGGQLLVCGRGRLARA